MFTPGHWRFGKNGDSVVTDTRVHPELIEKGSLTNEQETLAYYGGHLICESVTRGNAALIVAAPLMYEWLEQWLAHHRSSLHANEVERLLILARTGIGSEAVPAYGEYGE